MSLFHFIWSCLLVFLWIQAVKIPAKTSWNRPDKVNFSVNYVSHFRFFLLNFTLLMLVLALIFLGLHSVFSRVRPFVEVVDLRVPRAGSTEFRIGRSPLAEFSLPDAWTAPIHGLLASDSRQPVAGLSLALLAPDRRLEINGRDAGAVNLKEVAEILLEPTKIRPIAIGTLSVDLEFTHHTEESQASKLSLRAPWWRYPLTVLPFVRDKYELLVGCIDPALLPLALESECSPQALRFFRRSGETYLGFFSPEARAQSTIQLRSSADARVKVPFQSWKSPVNPGDRLTLGTSSWQIDYTPEWIRLSAIARPPRIRLPLDGVELNIGSRLLENESVQGPDVVSISAPFRVPARLRLLPIPSRSAGISLLHPDFTFTNNADGQLWLTFSNDQDRIAPSQLGDGALPANVISSDASLPDPLDEESPSNASEIVPEGPPRLSPAGLLRLSDGQGNVLSLRLQSAFVPGSAVFQAESAYGPWWMLLVCAAISYAVILAVVLLLGILGPTNYLVFHLAALQFGIGCIMLAQLGIHSTDVRLETYGVKQLRAYLVGISMTLMVALMLWIRSVWIRRQLGPTRDFRARIWFETSALGLLDQPIWRGYPYKDGILGRLLAQPRVWLAYALATLLLVAQLPFGERGIAIPGLGSVQPIEAVKLLLLVYFSFWTARAIGTKAARANRVETLGDRLGYALHAVPVFLIMLLSYGLDDFSPILIVGIFLYISYRWSLLNPARGVERQARWYDSFALEQLSVLVVLPLLLYHFVLPRQQGINDRLLMWADPWSFTSRSDQIVGSFWSLVPNIRQEMWFGRGLGQPNLVNIPAVEDDFILALVGEQLGLWGVGLTMLTAALFVFVSLKATLSLSEESRPDLAGSGHLDQMRLLMGGGVVFFIIQQILVFGSVSGALPVVGQPLPFIAAGGSHLSLFCIPVTAILIAGARITGSSDPQSGGRF